MAWGWLLVGFGVIAFFPMLGEGTSAGKAFLYSAMFIVIGLGMVTQGTRYKRDWIAVDNDGISKPWAPVSTRLPWKDVSEIRVKERVQLVLKAERPRRELVLNYRLGYHELVDRICLELNRVRGPLERKEWLTGGIGFKIEAEDLVLERGNEQLRVPFKLARRVVLGVDDKGNMVPTLVLTSGNHLLTPFVGPTLSFDALRAISFALYGGDPPELSADQRQKDAASTSRIGRKVIVRGLIVAVCAIILRSCVRSLRE